MKRKKTSVHEHRNCTLGPRCHRGELGVSQGSEPGGLCSLPRWVRRKWGQGRGLSRWLWANESRREIQIDGDSG